MSSKNKPTSPAKGGAAAGNAGGNLSENNNRGSSEKTAQGEGKINAGTDTPAQGIDNANKEAERESLTGGPLVDRESGMSSVNTDEGQANKNVIPGPAADAAEQNGAGQPGAKGPNENTEKPAETEKPAGNAFSGGKESTDTSETKTTNLQDEAERMRNAGLSNQPPPPERTMPLGPNEVKPELDDAAKEANGGAGLQHDLGAVQSGTAEVGTATTSDLLNENSEKSAGQLAMDQVGNDTLHGGVSMLKEIGSNFVDSLAALRRAKGDKVTPEAEHHFNTSRTKVIEAVMNGSLALNG